MATSPTKLMTFAEADQLPAPPDGHYELPYGELVKTPFPKMDHHFTLRRLRLLLDNAAGEAGIVEPELGFRALPEHEYRRADLAYVSRTVQAS